MRKNSKKQTAASRTNGAKSAGPTSPDGKHKSRLNALKDGLFSAEVVVTAAGERVEDFEKFKASVWDSVQPDGALQEMLANDLVVNWWRRQRVRRCESAELKNRLEDLNAHDMYLRSDEIEPLKVRFCLVLGRHRATTQNTPPGDLNEIVMELENARSQLASTSLGLEFLIETVNGVKSEAESTGQMSDASLGALRACVGLANDSVKYCIGVNRINKTESAKAAERARARQRGGTGQTKEVEPEEGKSKKSGGETEAYEWDEAGGKAMLVSAIEIVARPLKVRKQVLEAIEKWQGKTRFAAAVLPADSTCDRFSRAETAFDRRFYRALAALLTIKQAKNASKLLP
ncbi:MAG: hypothetical protein ABSE40_20855 [Candidatus Sulfotelmatobacter sp.]